ncbi:MAG: COG1361 S-layer family protein [Candidatus Woesearchaeota archaeon]
MKKTYIIYLLIALFALQFATAAPSLQASLSKYEPYPASPGDTVKVWVLVQNDAPNDNTDTARNVVVEIVPEYPFSLYSDSSTKTIPLLGAKKDYLVDFTLKVDEKAVQGTNTFKVLVRDSQSSIQVEETLSLFVQSRDTTLSIESVTIMPQEISPGSEGTINIEVKNIAPNTFTDLSMKLYLQTIVGSTVVDLPFAPVDSSAEQRIYRLESGETESFKFKVQAYPDAESKVYKIPFTLEYYDNLGNKKNKSDYIGVVVNSNPEISTILDRTDITNDKRSGTVTLKIINKGLGEIKFLNVVLQESDDYEILSESAVNYVGNLESDDYQTIDYKIALHKDTADISIPVKLEYRDSTNKYYEVVQNVPLNLIDSGKLDAANGKSSATLVVVIILVLAIAAWIWYKKTRKSKKGQFA